MTLATGQNKSGEWRVASGEPTTRPAGAGHLSLVTRHSDAFTLIELILVLALLVIITSIAVPAMSRFIRGRALDSEARRMSALLHAAQSRAVSEGMPMMLWVNEKNGTYGLEAETSGQNGDAKAEDLTVDATLQISVLNLGTGAQTTFKNLPAIRFLPDGTVDETSPQTLELQDSVGTARWLVETKTRTGYEVNSTAQ
jgi:type II secretion system protein H